MSPYDGSLLSFEKLGDGVLGYSSPDERTEITLEAQERDAITLQPGETLLEFAQDRYCPPDRCSLRSRQEDGYTVHDLIMTDPQPDFLITGYAPYERDDAIVSFGYGIPSTTTAAIQRSFRFIQEDLLR